MNDREMAVREMADAAADAILRLENAKGWLGDLTPPEAALWVAARQACDRLYLATNDQTNRAIDAKQRRRS